MHTVGVLVPDGHPAWPPRLPAGADEPSFIKAATAAGLKSQTEALDALVWVPGVAAGEVVDAYALKPKWVHSFPAGVDGLAAFLASDALKAKPALLSNGRGAFSSSLAEYVIAACLHFNKQLARCAANRDARKWDPFVMSELRGKTVGFVGWGHIATTSARLCEAFGMRVVACRRSAADGAEPRPEATYAPADRLKLFAEADFVVCSLPGTAETYNFCGAAEFAAMKADAVFVSLGRGAAVDEDALAAALESGSIAGAALDVFKTEPLPEASPLWGLGDKVLLTAHNADLTADYFEQGWRVFAENYEQFARGAGLATPFDAGKGY